MKQPRTLLLCATLLVALLAGTRQAHANCAAPLTYYAVVDSNTVYILPENFGFRRCEDNVLVREDVTSGEVVQLATYCTECPIESNAESDETCFFDECVPAGTYRYGFLVPYDCSPDSCGTDYYTEVTVVGTTEDCTYSDGNAPPQVVSEGAPWGDDPTICGYAGGCGACSAAPGAPRSVFGFQLFALAVGSALLIRKRRRV